MSESVHGHEVLQMLLAAREPLTPQAIEARIRERFGPRARFHTCSLSDLTASELVAFFQARGKLAGGPDGLGVDRSQICDS